MELSLVLVAQCPSQGFKRVGDDWASLSCEYNGGEAMKATISGDFKSTVVVRVELKVDGRLTTIHTKTARWLSPTCANAMVPGDVAYPGVPKFNVRNVEETQRSLEAVNSYPGKRFLEKKGAERP